MSTGLSLTDGIVLIVAALLLFLCDLFDAANTLYCHVFNVVFIVPVLIAVQFRSIIIDVACQIVCAILTVSLLHHFECVRDD